MNEITPFLGKLQALDLLLYRCHRWDGGVGSINPHHQLSPAFRYTYITSFACLAFFLLSLLQKSYFPVRYRQISRNKQESVPEVFALSLKMAATPTTNIKVVFGAMTFGTKGVEQARVHTIPECAAILDVFQSYGHQEIDTARTYCDVSSQFHYSPNLPVSQNISLRPKNLNPTFFLKY